jgi:hypothetical protein
VTRGLALVLVLAATTAVVPAQEVSREYQVKAAFLFNFAKFVEWPTRPATEPLVICVAGVNPFGGLLDELVRGEQIDGRDVHARVILEPDDGCHEVFIPRGANMPVYLRAARNSAVLTIGETPEFIEQGGLVRFYLDAGQVRFEIARAAAERAQLRISSRLLKLARIVDVAARMP